MILWLISVRTIALKKKSEKKKMEHSNSEEEDLQGIDKAYVNRAMIGSLIATVLVSIGIYLLGWFIVWVSSDEPNPVDQSKMWPIIYLSMAIFFVVVNCLVYLVSNLYVNHFSYSISDKFIKIRYGVFTRTKTTIPFSRIQNVAVFQNIRDRILNIYTVKIETAGASIAGSGAQGGTVHPEGYIPAVRNPEHLESLINKLVHQYTQDISGNVKENVFTDNNVAFDEFIAYFLSKMREKNQIRTNVEQLRTQSGMTQEKLAEMAGVAETTIKYLEDGEYVPSLTLALRIAQIFKVSIEQIFQLN
ncbi:hypothetical protein NEF87_000566 [Candidatus Lokiarchaeum ossiferum]|uniref:HTH cro/C1-type domain-containing protein n=1 Tax=Candidatus Lokiarchaeum ossiferum TaxID=2951803 RepID=A0ABY6HP25_9ARCH|nr:hypothetical protein NEF87_000566 [Candidatus Lokiarchaeum sp. B-35]